MPVTEGGKALSTFLLLVVLPPGGSLTRRTIKRLGDINVGFATQCLMVIKHPILSIHQQSTHAPLCASARSGRKSVIGIYSQRCSEVSRRILPVVTSIA